MAFDATTILQLVGLITWNCLSQPVHKNGLFKLLFFDRAFLDEILTAASLCFCPGLFEAIQAATPPALSFFENLPAFAGRKWAVYALVLKKWGYVPLIYIGFGTNMTEGIRARERHYDNPQVHWWILPKNVRKALEDGYVIVHKGMLLWIDMPSAGKAPVLRLLFVGMEAAFSFLFWAMASRDKDYKIGACCPWSRKSFPYRGLCSHNAMLETVAGNFDLTPEQIEAIAAEVKEKNRLYHVEYYKKMKEEDPEGLKARMAEADKRYRENSRDKSLAKQQRFAEKAKESRKYFCEVSRRACTKLYEFERHLKSRNHLRKVEKAKAGIVKKHHCKLCGFSTNKPSQLDIHNLGKRHLERVGKAAAKAKSTGSLSGSS